MSTVILQKGERLLLELRPSLVSFFSVFFMGICFMGLPFFFFFVFWQFGWIGRGLFFLLFFLGARFTVRQWKRWKKILYRITDERIIVQTVNRQGNVIMQELPLWEIERVHFFLRGILSFLFCYGTICVRGKELSRKTLFLTHVSHPANVTKFIKEISRFT